MEVLQPVVDRLGRGKAPLAIQSEAPPNRVLPPSEKRRLEATRRSAQGAVALETVDVGDPVAAGHVQKHGGEEDMTVGRSLTGSKLAWRAGEVMGAGKKLENEGKSAESGSRRAVAVDFELDGNSALAHHEIYSVGDPALPDLFG